MKHTYTILFEFLGKKMQFTNIEAYNKKEAEDIVKNKIIFYSIKNNNPYLEKSEDSKIFNNNNSGIEKIFFNIGKKFEEIKEKLK